MGLGFRVIGSEVGRQATGWLCIGKWLRLVPR